MLIVLAAVVSLSTARLCEVEASPSAAGSVNVPAAALVKDATLIVRARAVAPASGAPKGASKVLFEVEEVMKTATQAPPSRIALDGSLSQQDDFNRGPVPYDYVRPSGLRGSCYARSYRADADYLLMLVEARPGVFTPYWAPLLPTNEQLHGTDDPWLVWVRARVAAQPGGGRPPKN
jgi:hypothetical protein